MILHDLVFFFLMVGEWIDGWQFTQFSFVSPGLGVVDRRIFNYIFVNSPDFVFACDFRSVSWSDVRNGL
jgi:hypothetical protein